MADLRSRTPVKLINNATDSGLVPDSAVLADNMSNPTTTLMGAMAMLYDGATWDRAPGDSTNGMDVDVIRVAGSGATALADATANPSLASVAGFLMGFNGTTWDRVRTANTGRLQVDVVTGGGADVPTTPTLDTATSASVAAGSSANLDTADLGGSTRKLWQCTVCASVPWKAVIGQFENGASVKTLATLFGRAGEATAYRASHRDFTSRAFAANAGFDGFRAVVTNLDNSQAADVYASFEYSA